MAEKEDISPYTELDHQARFSLHNYVDVNANFQFSGGLHLQSPRRQ
jgi:hypothetical protein